MGVDMKAMLLALQEARRAALASLLREGVDEGEAHDESDDYVALPKERQLSPSTLAVFASLVGDAIPDEFSRLVVEVDLGTLHVWDADLRAGRAADSRCGDPYLDYVVEETLEFRTQSRGMAGLIVGCTDQGDNLFQSASGEQNSIHLVDHETGRLICRAADGLVHFVIANARVATEYWNRIEQGRPASADWVDECLAGLDLNGVSSQWLRQSLYSRPRPT
jgi:hypothetical protein